MGLRSLATLFTGRAGAVLKAGPALQLAAELGIELHVVPGGHGGDASAPRAFGARLSALLAR